MKGLIQQSLKRRLRIWPLAALTLALSVGVPSSRVEAQGQAPTWTVAVYVHADHNLDSSAVADLEEMMQVGSGPGLNIVVQVDRNDDEADPGVWRGLVTKGDIQILQELPELNSDSPSALQEFTDWAFKQFPAQRYGVILWDHGGQWDGGFGGDEHPGASGPSAGMRTQDITRVLTASLAKNNIPKLAFLSFDTCLMGGLELLGEFAPLADVYIANPELDYGDGWDYAGALALLKANPSLTPEAFARQEVASWRKHHQQDADVYYGVHVAYDTSRYAALAQAFQKFSRDMQGAFTQQQLQAVLWRARAQTVEYNFDPQEPDPGASTPYADLGLLADYVAQNTTSASLKDSAAQLKAALRGTILAISTGEEREDVGGLSVWYPTSRESGFPDAQKLSAYGQLRMNSAPDWTTFLRAWLTRVEADKTAPAVGEPKITAATAGQVSVTFGVQGDDVDVVFGEISRVQEDGTYLILGDQFYQYGKTGNLSFNWDYSSWVLSDGKNVAPVSNTYLEPGDPTFYIQARYTPPKGEAQDVALLMSTSGEVLGALDSSGIAPRGLTLAPGGTLVPSLTLYDPETDEYELVEGEVRLTIPAGGVKAMKAKRQRLPAGTYELMVGASDFVGNSENNFLEVELQ